MNREYTVLTTVVIVFTLVTAGAVWLLWKDLGVSSPSLVVSDENVQTPRRQVGRDAEPVPVAFNASLVDVYGVSQSSEVAISLDEITKKARYSLAIEDLALPREGGRYLVWVQTDEGPVTRIGELTFDGGSAKLSTVAAVPQEGWFVLVTYEDGFEGEQELVLRGEVESAI